MKMLVVVLLGLVSVALGQSPACVDVSDTGVPPATAVATGANTCFTSPGFPASILPRRRCAWRFQAPAGTKLSLTCPVNLVNPLGKLWHREGTNTDPRWVSGSGTYTWTFSGNDATVGLEARRTSYLWRWQQNNANLYWNKAGPGFSCCIIAA